MTFLSPESSSETDFIVDSDSPPRTYSQDRTPTFALPSTSLLSARRPSWTPSLPANPIRQSLSSGENTGTSRDDYFGSRHSLRASQSRVSEPAHSHGEDGGNFYQSLQFDMKGLVGDAVGNMSISPTSRDVVLAARRGLFIIDLETPFKVPRFLPQGGTWDVADVQWNPHPSRPEYIVSTSSEKLLIWNLLLVGKTSIEHILHSHYRAITDLNWHTSEPDTVASTGIDSWIWAWDLREPRKPIFGLSDFGAGGTQVKWNRQDSNILASSHLSHVLVWDRRKGSLPITKLNAHKSKIYGIDWSHDRRSELITCSLDKTIKVWNVQMTHGDEETLEPNFTICTGYPVWRARDLPFGHGILSLPQRGETGLEMWAQGESTSPTEVFEGHTDVVKEFVWRRGGQDGSEFQLITWSKDRTLRFWPVDYDTMEKFGHRRGDHPRPELSLALNVNNDISFRNPPEGTDYPPALSAPIGTRSILAEVRAPLPPRQVNPVMQPHLGSTARGSWHDKLQLDRPGEHDPNPSSSVSLPNGPAAHLRGGKMTRGSMGGRVDPFAWIAIVKVGERKESSGSGAESSKGSRLRSRSSNRSVPDHRANAQSRRRSAEERRDGDHNQSLQNEITSVLKKLAHYKVKLEKHDLTKKRTCTLGLHGPWSDSGSAFIRVTFTFPREYPQAISSEGTPTVDLEKNELIRPKKRKLILRRLQTIAKKRPCLEACLRYLLFASEDEQSKLHVPDEPGSSSEDDYQPASRKAKDFTASLMRHKNLAEPRTSQGVFGPHGQLVCFFRAPPRIVRNPLNDISISPGTVSRRPEEVPRLFQSPALLSDAVRRLGLAALDRVVKPIDPRKPEDGENTLRIMTNILTRSQGKVRRESDSSKRVGADSSSYSLLPTRRSTVFIASTSRVTGPDKKVAMQYVFEAESLGALCEQNAVIAREHGRFDHQRAFLLLKSLFPVQRQSGSYSNRPSEVWYTHTVGFHLLDRLHSDLLREKDVQMLAMASTLLLHAFHSMPRPHETNLLAEPSGMTPSTGSMRKYAGGDYFSLGRRKETRVSPVSPGWPRLSSPAIPAMAPSLSSSNSSKGSWSSLFNSGSVRQFMSGVQDTFKDGLTTPSEILTREKSRGSIPVPKGDLKSRAPDSPRGQGQIKGSAQPQSWPIAPTPSLKPTLSFASAGHSRHPGLLSPKISTLESRTIVFFGEKEIVSERTESTLIPQLVCHILAYADVLFRWQLFHQRLEMLKSVNLQTQSIAPSVATEIGQYGLGLVRTCTRCNSDLRRHENGCPSCGCPTTMPQCSICRIPVKGLSRSCLRCLHVTHINCWKERDFKVCGTGCGCLCTGHEADKRQDSVRATKSPRSAILPLS